WVLNQGLTQELAIAKNRKGVVHQELMPAQQAKQFLARALAEALEQVQCTIGIGRLNQQSGQQGRQRFGNPLADARQVLLGARRFAKKYTGHYRENSKSSSRYPVPGTQLAAPGAASLLGKEIHGGPGSGGDCSFVDDGSGGNILKRGTGTVEDGDLFRRGAPGFAAGYDLSQFGVNVGSRNNLVSDSMMQVADGGALLQHVNHNLVPCHQLWMQFLFVVTVRAYSSNKCSGPHVLVVYDPALRRCARDASIGVPHARSRLL